MARQVNYNDRSRQPCVFPVGAAVLWAGFSHQNQKGQLSGNGAASIQAFGADFNGYLGIVMLATFQGIFSLLACSSIIQNKGGLASVHKD